MKLLEDMSIGSRVAVTIGIVLAILFALALFGYLTGSFDSAQGAAKYEIPERFQRELIDLDRISLNAAYTNHVDHLFRTWVSQISNLGHEPSRITTGLSHLHQAWVTAAEELEKREQKLKEPRQ